MTISASAAQTTKFGERLSRRLQGGDIVCLYGELGAGKTTLVKGIAKGLGVKKNITSPTFALMNLHKLTAKSYKLKVFVHIDTYRLKNERELIDIGAEDYLGKPDIVCVIEWPEKVKSLLKNKNIVKVTMEHASKSERKIKVSRE